MGYYSDVRIVVSNEGFKRLSEYVTEHTNDINLLNNCDVFIKGNNEICIGWNFLKWRNEFPEVKTVLEGLEILENEDYSYRLSRLGSDSIEEFEYYSKNKEKDICLSHPNIENYFNDEEISLEMGAISEKNYNIRSFLDYFKNKNVYELETALAIHEYLDKNGKEISDDNIDKIFDIIRSEDDVFNEYLKEMVCNLNENLEQDMTESEEEMEM